MPHPTCLRHHCPQSHHSLPLKEDLFQIITCIKITQIRNIKSSTYIALTGQIQVLCIVPDLFLRFGKDHPLEVTTWISFIIEIPNWRAQRLACVALCWLV